MAVEAENQLRHSKNPTNGKVIKILWLLAAATALLLSMATIDLSASFTAARSGTGATGYLTGGASIVLLREAPGSTAAVAAIVSRGESVEILSQATAQNAAWFQVKTAAGSGWVPAEWIGFQPPVK